MKRLVPRAWIFGSIAGIAALLGLLLFWYLDGPPVRPFAGPATSSVPGFVDRTADFGLTVAHRQGDDRITGLDESLGSGACVLDFDNDGWMDLFVVNGSGDTRYYGQRHWWQKSRGHRLLKNSHGRQFIDVTEQAKITSVSRGMGCVAADLDNDGDSDLFVTNIGSNLLLQNNGDGSFSDATRAAGLVDEEGWHTAAAVADADGDGLLDLYVGGFIDFVKGSKTYEPGSQYKQDTSPFFNSALYPAMPNRLYRNLGGLRFTDVTDAAGVADADGRTLAALWTDVNQDRRPDLIVVNAAGTGSTVGYVNRGAWRFEPMGIQARLASGLSFHGVVSGDLDNDGSAELMLTGAAGNQSALLFAGPSGEGQVPAYTDLARQWNLSKEQFAAFAPWGAAVEDFNNDGWADIMVGNGQILPDPDSPHVTVGQSKQLWLNNGKGQLVPQVPAALSPLLDRQSARGLVSADFDNDGDLDVYVAHNNDVGQLLINELQGSGRWLGVDLGGRRRNHDATGARVEVTTEQGTQVKWLTQGSGFLSDADPRVHFGLGAARSARVVVTFGDGSTLTRRNVELDRYLHLSTDRTHRAAPVEQRAVVMPEITVSMPPAVRKELFLWLSTAPVADEAAYGVLHAAFSDPSEEVRAAVVVALRKHKSTDALRILLRLLEDRREGVAVLAVDAVCGYQEEAATRYLVRLFAHPAARVRRQVADCFTQYYRDFQEEQAVIHRKYLAVPYLAGLLTDADTEVRIAAARALGAAEKFRGVAPLMRMLQESDTAQRDAAVRALGLIRDRYALPPLLELLGRVELPASTRAQLFIALKRLDYERLEPTLADFARGRAQFAGVGAEVRLAALLAVLQSEDGVVLAREQLLGWAREVYRGASGQARAAMLYARIVEQTGVRSEASSIAPLARHPDAEVRWAALSALFMVDPGNRPALASQALRDDALQIRQNMLQLMASSKAELPDALLYQSLQQDATRRLAIEALGRPASEPIIAMLAGWVQDGAMPTAIRSAALRALGRARQPVQVPESWYQTDDTARLAVLRYEGQRLPAMYFSKTAPPFIERLSRSGSLSTRRTVFDFLLTREELWAKSKVVSLLSSNEDPALRHHVLRSLPENYLEDAGVVLQIAADRGDALRLEALRKLRGTTNATALTKLVQIAGNLEEEAATRTLAACALPVSYTDKVLPTLLRNDH